MQPMDIQSIAHILPIIMAGGRGERLSPMTDTVPKPLLPVDGVPAIVRILRLLSSLGFTRAAVTLGYRADDIRAALGTECEGIALSYAVEVEPLGTAGGVLLAWDLFAMEGDTDALILSGDAVFSLDISGFLAHHRQFSADATVLSVRVSDPSAFGALVCDGEGRIRAFCEKPSAMETVTDLVNTGIYLLSAAFLSSLPRGRFLDFGADVFLAALARHCVLYAYSTEGYWCDIGTVEAFLSCVTALADGSLSAYSPLLMPSRHALPPHVSHSSVGKGCFLPASASVRDCVLFDNVSIGAGASVSHAVLCEGVVIGEHAIIGTNSVIGQGARIAAGAVLPPRTRVAPYAVIARAKASVTEAVTARVSHTEDAESAVRPSMLADFTHDSGIYLSARATPTVPDAAVCRGLGRALVRLFAASGGEKRALVFALTSDGVGISEALALTALAAMAEWDAMEERHRPTVMVCENAVSFVAARFFPSPAEPVRILFSHTDGRLSAVLAFRVGRYLSRAEERRLDALLSDFLVSAPPAVTETVSKPLYLSSARIEDDFLSFRLSLLSSRPLFVGLSFRVGPSPSERLLARFLHTLGAKEDGKALYAYHIFEAGDLEDDNGVLAMSDLCFPTRIYDHWELYAMWLASCAPPPALLSLPFGVPQYVISLAIRCGAKVELYPHYPREGTPVRAPMPSQEASDPILLALRITSLLFDRGVTLGELYQNAFGKEEIRHVRLRRSYAGISAPSVLRRMADGGLFSAEKEGLSYVPSKEDGSSVRICNSRTHTLRITADALSMESAEALCEMVVQELDFLR